MPKIKLFITDTYAEDYSFLQEYSIGWQEVTEEELKFLKSLEGQKILNNNYKNNYTVIIYEDVTKDIPNLIENIKEYIEKEKEKIEKEKVLAAKKREEAKAKKEAKEIEKAKKLLEEKGIL